MGTNTSTAGLAPLISVIVTVYNGWGLLEGCLRSIEAQSNPPPFEVIVIDDGSESPATESIRKYETRLVLSIVRKPHAGIAAARNRGVVESKGEVLVFTDADCRFESTCLSKLERTITAAPEHNCFQLHLTGDVSTLVGRAEELRLIALQEYTIQPDGRIRLLNTSGFAIRRTHPRVQSGLFDPEALRGEDTLLLANLIRGGELPLFVPNATVQHSVSLSLAESYRKDLRSGWLEAKTFNAISATGIRIRMTNMDRIRMALSTWKMSGQNSIGRAAWFVLISRQFIERTVTVFHRCLPGE